MKAADCPGNAPAAAKRRSVFSETLLKPTLFNIVATALSANACENPKTLIQK
jgi:hypothetical protein